MMLAYNDTHPHELDAGWEKNWQAAGQTPFSRLSTQDKDIAEASLSFAWSPFMRPSRASCWLKIEPSPGAYIFAFCPDAGTALS